MNVPAPKPRPIKQDDLQQILTLRLEVETCKRELKKAEEECLKAELLVVDRLKHGAVQAPGELVAGIREVAGQRRAAWKEEFAKALGPEAVERVMQTTVPGPTREELEILRAGKVAKSA